MTDERLERIESILQATVVLTQQNREDIAQLTREVRTIAGSFERTNERLRELQRMIDPIIMGKSSE